MTRATRSPMGPVARILYLALPFAAMACGGDETQSVGTAEARSVTPVTTVSRVAPPTTMETRTLGGDIVTPTPTDAQGFYALGLTQSKAGNFHGAKEAFDRSIELDGKFAKAYFNQGRVLLELKRAPEALEVITKGREIDSTSSDGWRLVARAKYESGDVEGALQTYRDLLVRDEMDAWGLNNLGMLLLDRGDVLGSLGPLARAVQVRGTAPIFLNNLGMALEKSGYAVAAMHRYELAVKHDTTYAKAVNNVERMKALGIDGTLGDEVDVKDLAEGFRLTIKSWKVDVPKVDVPKVEVPKVEVPES
jgi:tetratricopeptide (TPR) repeat protein